MDAKPIKYASRPITFDDLPLDWLPGMLVDNGDGTFAVKLDGDRGFLSVNPDGSYTSAMKPAGTFERCVPGIANTLTFAPYGDRPMPAAAYEIPFRDQ